MTEKGVPNDETDDVLRIAYLMREKSEYCTVVLPLNYIQIAGKIVEFLYVHVA